MRIRIFSINASIPARSDGLLLRSSRFAKILFTAIRPPQGFAIAPGSASLEILKKVTIESN